MCSFITIRWHQWKPFACLNLADWVRQSRINFLMKQSILLLMEEIPRDAAKTPVNNGRNYQPQLARISEFSEPSTVGV